MFTRLRSTVLAFLTLGAFSAAAAWQASRQVPEQAGELLPTLRRSGPQYWKGNLHTHSFWSDGDDFPEMIADWYKRHGYQFLGLSDHNVLSEGERWIDIAADKAIRKEALEKYQTRFGQQWVQQRTQEGKSQVGLNRSAEEEKGRR